jgi:hypothetical protein
MEREMPLYQRIEYFLLWCSMPNILGIVVKDVARAVVDFNALEIKCRDLIDQTFLCSLVSNDSAPGAIQAFFAVFGPVFGLQKLFPEQFEENPQKFLVAGALLTHALILVGELISLAKHGEFNMADLVTETLGTLPALAIMYWFIRENQETEDQ